MRFGYGRAHAEGIGSVSNYLEARFPKEGESNGIAAFALLG
jgi:hypothetical protein